jgi:ATP-dependent RNA helicase DeaD
MINRLVNISQIDFCILDEADEMLNMGFYEDIVNINYARRNTWLFSATMPAEVARIGKQFMKDPEITVGKKFRFRNSFT